MRLRPRWTLGPALLLGALLLAIGSAAEPPTVPANVRRQAFEHYKAGEAALESEHFQQAVEEFEKAISLDPLLVMAHYGLGKAHMALKEYPEAVRAYVACRQAFKDDMASRLEKDSGWEQRLDSQIRAIEDQIGILNSGRPAQGSSHPISTLNPQYLQQQLDTLRSLRRKSGVTVEPTPPWISVALGGAYFRANALADAEREYKAALEVGPKVGEAHNNLAVIYLLTNRIEDAQREVVLAEGCGFKVPEGLKHDIALRAAAQP